MLVQWSCFRASVVVAWSVISKGRLTTEVIRRVETIACASITSSSSGPPQPSHLSPSPPRPPTHLFTGPTSSRHPRHSSCLFVSRLLSIWTLLLLFCLSLFLSYPRSHVRSRLFLDSTSFARSFQAWSPQTPSHLSCASIHHHIYVAKSILVPTSELSQDVGRIASGRTRLSKLVISNGTHDAVSSADRRPSRALHSRGHSDISTEKPQSRSSCLQSKSAMITC